MSKWFFHYLVDFTEKEIKKRGGERKTGKETLQSVWFTKTYVTISTY